MAVRASFTPESEADIVEAYAWYEMRRAGLGEEFLSAVDAGIASICRNPESCQVVHGQFRRLLLRRFPYAVFYEPDESAVTIYGVFHVSRSPKGWQGRVGKT